MSYGFLVDDLCSVHLQFYRWFPNSIFIHLGDVFFRLRSLTHMLQSGKSAAIYACAREQGFEVLEVLKL